MANFRYQIQITQTDGTAFSSANEAGAAARLRNSDSAGTNSSAYGSFTEVSNGYWYIEIDEEDSGWFLVQTYTTASLAWADLSGKDPVYIQLEPSLALDGGTMSGDINMDDNSITGVDTITFDDSSSGTIAGIVADNLVDKSAAETLSGNNTFSGDCTFSGTNTMSGEMDFTTDKLKINSIIVQPYIYITKSFPGTSGRAEASVNSTIFIADAAYQVVSLDVSTNVKSTADCHLQLEKLSDADAAKSGDDILTDNGGLGIDLNSTARKSVSGTIDTTNGTLASGERLGIYIDAEATALEGTCITVKLKRV